MDRLRPVAERLFVSKGHWPQAHQPAAGIAHILDVFLVAPRGLDGGELSAGVDHDWHSVVPAGADAVDTRDVGEVIGAGGSDADDAAVAGHTQIADIDVIATGGRYVIPGLVPDRDVLAPLDVGIQCLIARRRIAASCGIGPKREGAASRVVVPDRVEAYRTLAESGIIGPGGVV